MPKPLACSLLVLIAFAMPAAAAPALVFSTAASPEHDAIKALMQQEGGVDIKDKWLNIAPIDLDLDGVPELFVMAINTDYFCGDAGCVPEIYQRDGQGWRKIDLGLNEFINSDLADWTVLPEPQHGRLALKLTESQFSTTFVWDGTGYVSLEALSAESSESSAQ